MPVIARPAVAAQRHAQQARWQAEASTSAVAAELTAPVADRFAAYSTAYPYQSLIRRPQLQKVLTRLREQGLVEGTHYQLSYSEFRPGEAFAELQLREWRAIDREDSLGCAWSGEFSACVEQLKRDASAHCARPPPFPTRTIPELAADAEPAVVLDTLLAQSTGLVLGEAHHDISSKQLLIDHTDLLVRHGVRTVFLEHLLFERHQVDLDAYVGAPSGSPMPPALRAHLEHLDWTMMRSRNGPYGIAKKTYCFTKLVEALQRAGIKMIAIDCKASYAVHKSDLGATRATEKTRYEVMNYLADLKIAEHAAEGKWIAFIGSGHANTALGVPGVAELTGGVSLIVSDERENPGDPLVRTHVKGFLGEIDPDVVMVMGRDG